MDSKTLQDTQKIVVAGMKLMYDKQTRPQLQAAMRDGPAPEILASNIIGIIKVLWEKSGKKLPPASIGPATMILVYELASFVRESGKEIDPSDVEDAAYLAMEMLKELFAKIGPKCNPQAQQPQAQPQPEQAPAQDPAMQQQPQAQPQAGLIGA